MYISSQNRLIRPLLGIMLIVGFFIASCKTAQNPNAVEDSQVSAASGSTGGGLIWPTPGGKSEKISAADQAAVLNAWLETKKNFYDTQLGYDSVGRVTPLSTETQRCTRACPDYYSSLVCHFYCWYPSYEQVVPNVRGCFSNLARGSVQRTNPARVMFYPEMYDYCLYQPYDVVKNPPPKPQPVFSQATIDQNKKRGASGKVGVLKWVDDNQRDVFKYVMFTSYNPFAFALEDQQAIINKFYGVDLKGKTSYTASDTVQVNECNSSKRMALAYEPSDGTHCSYTMDTTSFDKHPNFNDNVAYLKSLPATHTRPGNTAPTPPASHTTPMAAAYTLQKGVYKTKKTTNSSCEIEVGNIHVDSSKNMKWFSITYGPKCVADGKKIKDGTKVNATDCGGNDCDFKLDPSNPLVLLIKDNDKFAIQFAGSKENWAFARP